MNREELLNELERIINDKQVADYKIGIIVTLVKLEKMKEIDEDYSN